MYTEMSDLVKQRANDLRYHQIATGETNELIENRILEDEITKLGLPESFTFINTNFSITPSVINFFQMPLNRAFQIVLIWACAGHAHT